MKKIFFALVAILGLWSCVQEELPVVNGNNPVVGEGEVLVEGSIYLPAMQDATRTFTTEAISCLHVLVFDENGYLIQVEPAKGTFGVEMGPAYNFTVALGQSGYKRTIHLVANSDIIIGENGAMLNDDGSTKYQKGEQMRHVLNQLYTTGGKQVFWGEVILPNGITGTESGDTYTPSEELQAALTKVPMVRNYTRVRLTNNAGNFQDAELVMMNILDRGSVVPLIRDGVYAQFSTRNGTDNTEKQYSDIIAQDYYGYELESAQLTNTDASSDNNLTGWIKASTAESPKWFSFYERYQQSGPNPVATPAFAIIRGHYVGADNNPDSEYTYYKVDLCYTDTASKKQILFNLLRNMQYNVIINAVSGRGYNSAQEAAANVATNNLSAAVETSNFNNISDGVRRLSVEYTEKVLTEGGVDYTLKYKYETNIAATGGAVNNSLVSFSGIYVDDNPDKGTVGPVITNPRWADDSEGWRIFTFTAAAVAGTKIQDIVLSAGTTDSGFLTRDVRYILGNPYTMTLDVPTKIANGLGIPLLESTITLPEGLPKSLFPLDIYIISENNSLTSSLPVITGLNSDGAPDPNGKYFGYVLTVEADNYFIYNDKGEVTGYNCTVPVDLKTNKVDAANPSGQDKPGTVVTAYNPYFYPAKDSFWVMNPYGLTLTLAPGFDESTAVTAFTINSNNLKIDDADWSLDPNNPTAKYFDFKFSFSNDNVELKDAKVANATTGNDLLQVVDGNTLRIYKNLYDGASDATTDDIRNYTLTFTDNSNAMIGTTITVSNDLFGTASATIERYAVSWSIVGNNNNNNQRVMESGSPYRLRIVLPAGISDAVINTLKIKATTTVTTLSLNGQSIANNSTGTINITSSMYNSSTGYIYVPITATTAADDGTRSFTLTLEGGVMFELPGTMTRTYSDASIFDWTSGYK